ncbi:MAG: HlyD family secretion protein, partial [Alphaproteobacteria bacterium]|nr:HlyD family secretion protein [Alphaproteobacteria bacterium]
YVEADMAVISSRVAGYIKRVAVDDNQAVRPGDTLVELEDVDYRARVAAAEADAARSGDLIGAADAAQGGRAAAIREAEAALAAAEAEATRAERDRQRLSQLLENRFVSRQRYDVAVAEAASRQAAVAQARAALVAARAGVAGAGAERGAAVAARSAATAQLEAARYDLANTRIVAPVAGFVGNRSARVGQFVRAGQQLMVVVPVDKAYVVANFKETQVARMRPGQPVTLTVDAYPDVTLKGRIVSLSPAAGSRFSILPPENATGNFTKIVQRIPIKILIDRPLPEGVRLVPGMSVRPSIDVRS